MLGEKKSGSHKSSAELHHTLCTDHDITGHSSHNQVTELLTDYEYELVTISDELYDYTRVLVKKKKANVHKFFIHIFTQSWLWLIPCFISGHGPESH